MKWALTRTARPSFSRQTACTPSREAGEVVVLERLHDGVQRLLHLRPVLNGHLSKRARQSFRRACLRGKEAEELVKRQGAVLIHVRGLKHLIDILLDGRAALAWHGNAREGSAGEGDGALNLCQRLSHLLLAQSQGLVLVDRVEEALVASLDDSGALLGRRVVESPALQRVVEDLLEVLELLEALVRVEGHGLADDQGAGDRVLAGVALLWQLHLLDLELDVRGEEDLRLPLEVAEGLHGGRRVDGDGAVVRLLGGQAVDLEDDVPEAEGDVAVGGHGGEGGPDELAADPKVLQCRFRVRERDAAPDLASVRLDDLVLVVGLENVAQLLDEGAVVAQAVEVVGAECRVHLMVERRLHRVELCKKLLTLNRILRKWLIDIAARLHDGLSGW
mmetsp:Transcript_150760/g.366122  ORF Transcript_150760/g.366122 Transcript_150760/m.366122 type:complete len:390 (+) Transcript_150760:33-1202(+)